MTSILDEREKSEQNNNSGRYEANNDSSETKNPETPVNNPSYFNDDYAAEQEDEISSDEARSEKSKRSGS